MKTFLCTAMDDKVYIQASNLKDAKEQLEAFCGVIPDYVIEWTELAKLPAGEEYIVDMRG